MKKSLFEIIENIPLTRDVMRMKLKGDTSAITAPGQFINIQIEGLFLRRPISVCHVCGDILTIIYKVVGEGTRRMQDMTGGILDILTGLGNGYDLSPAGESPLLIGGGAGVPPMYMLAEKILERGVTPKVILGFNTASEMFYADEFAKLGAEVTVATADGSMGVKGFATDAMKQMSYSYFYACGPEAMLKAVWEQSETDGQFSFEERMGCGFGACMGCSCKTLTGSKRICKEGPVLRKGEILWQK